MGKQRKMCFRRGLCGILSASMIMAGLLMPDATAYAAQTVTETEKESKVLDISGSEDAGEESGDGENSEENRGG